MASSAEHVSFGGGTIHLLETQANSLENDTRLGKLVLMPVEAKPGPLADRAGNGPDGNATEFPPPSEGGCRGSEPESSDRTIRGRSAVCAARARGTQSAGQLPKPGFFSGAD